VALSNDRADLRRDDRPWTAADTLKNVVVKLVYPDGRSEPLAVGLPATARSTPSGLAAQVAPAVVEPFTETDFGAHPALVRGYIGPQALGRDARSGVRYLVDPRVVEGTRWITGANDARQPRLRPRRRARLHP
jgi:prolyl-tRNA synthetase